MLPTNAHAQSWNDWHYHADISVLPQADDTFSAVYADFTHLLKSTFNQTATLDENSIRIVPLQDGNPTEPVAYRFEKVDDYNAATNAAGTLIFLVSGTKDDAAVTYRVYFDTAAKPALQNAADVPKEANMVWNGGFEILSQGYSGANRYDNAGNNMPRGWWGNLRNRNFTENKAVAAHSGRLAMGFVAPQDANMFIAIAPSPPGIRVQPQENYLFSFWIKGENLSSDHPTLATIRWLDKGSKQIERVTLNTRLGKSANYDWTQVSAYLPAPDNATFVSMSIGTYSKTGLMTVDDVVIRIAVPPSLGRE